MNCKNYYLLFIKKLPIQGNYCSMFLFALNQRPDLNVTWYYILEDLDEYEFAEFSYVKIL